MSLADVRTHFKTRCKELGYREHRDGLNEDNIGTLERVFHVTLGETTTRTMDHQTIELSAPVSVLLVGRPARTADEVIDRTVADAELLIKTTLSPLNRSKLGVKNISLVSLSIEPLDESNDNSIVAKLNFTALVVLALL